jgi:hypothetical protein
LISVRGIAVIQFVNCIESYLGVSVGEIDGGVYAKATAQPKTLADGRLEFPMIHEFVSADGSTLSTVDLAVATPIPGTDELRMYVLHTITGATGKFAGRTGTFLSFGVHNQTTGQGVQRFL